MYSFLLRGIIVTDTLLTVRDSLVREEMPCVLDDFIFSIQLWHSLLPKREPCHYVWKQSLYVKVDAVDGVLHQTKCLFRDKL